MVLGKKVAIFDWEWGRKERRAENALKIKLCHNTYHLKQLKNSQHAHSQASDEYKDKFEQNYSSFCYNFSKCSKIWMLLAYLKGDKQRRPRWGCFRIIPVCYSDKYFVNSSPNNPHLFENRKRKVFEILEHFQYVLSLICRYSTLLIFLEELSTSSQVIVIT